MKKPDITPGDWIATEPEQRSDMGFGFDHMGGFQQRILAPVTSDIGTVGSMTIAETHDSKANSKAIAALPKLLDALEQLKAIGDAGVAMRHETGKPTWSALKETKRITREALTAAGYTE